MVAGYAHHPLDGNVLILLGQQLPRSHRSNMRELPRDVLIDICAGEIKGCRCVFRPPPLFDRVSLEIGASQIPCGANTWLVRDRGVCLSDSPGSPACSNCLKHPRLGWGGNRERIVVPAARMVATGETRAELPILFDQIADQLNCLPGASAAFQRQTDEVHAEQPQLRAAPLTI